MSGVKTLLSGVMVAAMLVVSTAVPALAWHPNGKIVKKVQNVTTSSALADANDNNTAIEVKPGDTIRYVIEVRNAAAAAANNHNDMVGTVMTDTLPAGVELASQPTLRTISENLGRIKPGEAKTKEYTLKVTSQKNGEVIVNKACFTGDTEVNDNPQKGCDEAKIKVKVPVVPPKPEEPKAPTPEQPTVPQVQPELPTELPATGVETILGASAGVGVLTYAGYSYVRSRRILG
ncbi:MAG TPA: hypothetical protein VFZ58_02905 [Candidatus Saccharimonadales bacterium]